MRKCPNCLFENNTESLFCQECGFKLPEIKKKKISKHHIESDEDYKFVWTCDYCGKEFPNKKTCDLHEKTCDEKPISTNKNGIYQKLNKNNDLDDIIFKPKEKRSYWWIVVVVIGIFFLLILLINSSNNSSYNSDYQPTPTISQSFPLYQLNIEDIDSEWVGYGKNAILYITGTIKNSSSISAKNVEIRVDFYKDKNNQNLFDTRYFTLNGVANNGAYSFREAIGSLNYNGQFWYTTKINNAENY